MAISVVEHDDVWTVIGIEREPVATLLKDLGDRRPDIGGLIPAALAWAAAIEEPARVVGVRGDRTLDRVVRDQGGVVEWRSRFIAASDGPEVHGSGGAECVVDLRALLPGPSGAESPNEPGDLAAMLRRGVRSKGSACVPPQYFVDEAKAGSGLQLVARASQLVTVLALVLGIGFWLRAQEAGAAQSLERRGQVERYAQLFPGTPVPTVVSDRLESVLRTRKGVGGEVDEPALPTLMKIIASFGVPATVDVERITITGERVQVVGQASDHDDVYAFAGRMRPRDGLEQGDSGVRVDTLPDRVLRFTLSLPLGGESGR